MLTRVKAKSEDQLAQNVQLSTKLDIEKLVNSSVEAEKISQSKSSKASGSRKSVVSIDKQRRQLELETAEEKARLLVAAEEAKMKAKLEEVRMQAQIDLLDKKLNASLAELEERHSRTGSSASITSAALRTENWVTRQNANISYTSATQNARYLNRKIQSNNRCPEPSKDNIGLPSSVLLDQRQSATCTQDQAILKLADAVHDLAVGCARGYKDNASTDKVISRMVTPKELPIFRGDPMEWINFKQFYMESTKICQFSNAENVCRLRKCLAGEAKESVSALLMGNVAAENIIETLELRFGRPEIIISKIVSLIRKIPSLSLSYHNDIVAFSIKIKNCVAAAKTINQEDYLRSPELNTIILSKLPCSLITRWADYVYENKEDCLKMTRLEQLSVFLEIEAQKISNVGVSLLQSSLRKFESPTAHFHMHQAQKPQMVLAQSSELPKCLFCHKRINHIIAECPKFKRALRKDRWSFVRNKRICPKCLASDHDKNTCEAPECDVDNCGLPHHPILHWPAKPIENSVIAAAKDLNDVSEDCVKNTTTTETTATLDTATSSNVLLKYIRVQIHGPNGVVVTDALLDDGSTITMIDAKIAEKAGLTGQSERLQVRGAWNNSTLICQTEVLHVAISGKHSERYKIIARAVNGINLPCQHTKPGHYEHLSSIQEYLCTEQMKPSVIIGQDNYHLLAPLEVIEGDPNATRTVLGWSIHGQSALKRRQHGTTNTYVFNVCSTGNQNEDDLQQLTDLIRRSFAIDSLGVSATPRQCSEDVKALQILDTTARHIGNYWEVGLPWRNDSDKMKDSYPTAFNRLRSVEKKMQLDTGFQIRYKERVQHLLENNYAHVCVDPDAASDRLWYLPHFGVDNPNKKKLRLVFDAAAKSQGFSLNDYLLQGPDLLVSLFGVLLRFRENRIAIAGDIKDMFLRVQIRKEDQDALRFLWREKSTDAPIVYCMNSLIFGACCSPFVAQHVKNKNAMRFKHEFPRAVTSIIQNHYMDDLMDSIETESEAIKLAQEVYAIHKSGGFEIRNWISNSKKVLQSLPKEDLSPSAVKFNLEGISEGERALGIYWFPADDMISFDISLKRINEQTLKYSGKPTKRQVLQVVVSIFDIQGFLAPLTIRSRILLQDVWRSGINWDEAIKDKEITKWRNWLKSLEQVKSLCFPRWYMNAATSPLVTQSNVTERITERELHLFCDASPQAYASVAYWRILDGNNVIVSFIASKSRVAPLRPVSVPRLELQGAVLACRLATSIEKEHTIKADRRYFWTNSSTVLHWIKSDARNYKAYVANRLGEIDEHTKINEWRYVPTTMNVADFATKEIVDELTYDHSWFHGPEFLHFDMSLWPKKDFNITSNTDKDIELNKACLNVLTPLELIPIPDPLRFSSWTRLLRATATLLAAVNKFRKRNSIVDETTMDKAEKLILRQAQLDTFFDEITELREKKLLSKKSRIMSLSPYLDDDEVLRVQGRIDLAVDVNLEAKRPAILDGKHHVARLIIMHYHVLLAHANNETVINELRQRVWVVHLRPSVRSVASKCLVCRIRKATPIIPRQGDLPDGRVAHHCRPFSHCGLDLFGPIDVVVGRRKEKRYGVIFTCMTVRAIHLEIVHSMTTDSLLMALRRMASRRGWPSDFYSDNGTNLRGAQSELQKLQTDITNRRSRWHFNPPLSPHMGGAWERLIRSVKTALKVILKERAPRDETLLTLFCEVEAIVNSRPLTHVSVSPTDAPVLTPFHFLFGTSSNLPTGTTEANDLCSRRQWRIAQRLADMFWSRWLKEVLPCLLPRTTRHTSEEQLKAGDVVLVIDPSSERSYWPRGIVEEIYPGADGRVRVVDVRTSRGTLRHRSTQCLVRLPSNPGGEKC